MICASSLGDVLEDHADPFGNGRAGLLRSAKISPVFVSEIISYPELVAREKPNLQKGMNFGISRAHSIILMSVRRGAPYHDRLDLDRNLLTYEGHDVHRPAGARRSSTSR